MSIKIAIVEDNRTVREGLAFLVGNSPGFECVGQWASGEEALDHAPKIKPNVVLMDIGLPGMSGIECITRLKEILPDTQVMMLTVFEDDDRVFQSLSAGATGYLLKKTHSAQILEAIADLHRGGAPMSSQIARRVVEAFKKSADPPSDVDALTPREKEILGYLANGFLYKEIAEMLGIRVDTVRTHIRNLYEKLQVRTRMQAVNKAMPNRPISPFLKFPPRPSSDSK
ncbi:MAG TPA: response regulator transcription factor [Candidatus Paceibacterota bacterium]|nr:response regulator transcription factor [Verrucomicrobiota bacterium]HRY49163.1 response regulator transcription factor [Candidatus Paceibacterota bacterium]HSA02517.1 response regulator transcription factor [Candidatus Paceibacterota bacterium]